MTSGPEGIEVVTKRRLNFRTYWPIHLSMNSRYVHLATPRQMSIILKCQVKTASVGVSIDFRITKVCFLIL